MTVGAAEQAHLIALGAIDLLESAFASRLDQEFPDGDVVGSVVCRHFYPLQQSDYMIPFLLLHDYILRRFDAGGLHYTWSLRFKRTNLEICKDLIFKRPKFPHQICRQLRVLII